MYGMTEEKVRRELPPPTQPSDGKVTVDEDKGV
jgi:hypothetical protein